MLFVLGFSLLLSNTREDCPENFTLSPQSTSEETICIPNDFVFSVTVAQAGYVFYNVSINDVPISNEDWVGVFYNDTCIGASEWDPDNCNNGICSVVAFGADQSNPNYIVSGAYPEFKIYDKSENIYYN